jgi:hypothetical protein
MRQAQQPQARAFGVDGLRCLFCKGSMTMIRRRPHPEHGEPFELQTFTCSECKTIMTRSADKDGNQVS